MKKRISLVILGLFFLLQFYPVDRTNPKEEAPLKSDEAVIGILKRSCFDCHSNQTKWPYYSYIFPVSLFLNHHIEEGRAELNFSDWEKLSLKKRATLAGTILEEIEEKEMPLFSYTLIHREASLSLAEIQVLKEWADKVETAYQEEP